MSAKIMEAQLWRLLAADPALRKLGCEAAQNARGGVVILAGGKQRGHWAWSGHEFVFTPEGATAPTSRLETAVEVLIATRAMVSPPPTV